MQGGPVSSGPVIGWKRAVLFIRVHISGPGKWNACGSRRCEHADVLGIQPVVLVAAGVLGAVVQVDGRAVVGGRGVGDALGVADVVPVAADVPGPGRRVRKLRRLLAENTRLTLENQELRDVLSGTASNVTPLRSDPGR